MDRFLQFASVLPDPLAIAGVVIIVGFAATRFAFPDRPIALFICHLAFFIGLTVALFAAGVVPYMPTPSTVAKARLLVVSVYKVIWWIAAARLSGGFIHAFMKLETKPRESQLLQDLLAGLTYIGAIFAIIAYVFDLPVQTLIATSGAIAIILGLALQSTLGDVFSGIVLDLAKPYRPGDWVIFDADTQGTVVEMNWRATQIITASNDLATVPNSTIAKSKLVNLGHPTKAHGLAVRVSIASTASPSTICTMLDAALLGSNRILHTPRPTVTVMALNAVSTECELYFFVSGSDVTNVAKTEVFDLVHRHATAAGLRLAPPPGSPVMVSAGEQGGKPHGLLDHVAFFATLTDEERASLALKLRRRSYDTGETVIEIGGAIETLIIIASGVLVASRKEGEMDVELVRLGPGDFLGAACVLTDAVAAAKIAALSNAVVLELSKEDLAAVLKERPSIATELTKNLVRRELAAQQRLEHLADHAMPQEDLVAWLAQRARMLFHLS